MPFTDLHLAELERYQAERSETEDFERFWSGALAAARDAAIPPVFEPIETDLALVRVHDVIFSGYDGQRIKGWFLVPRNVSEPVPCIVEYVGYGGGRMLPSWNLLYAAAGYAHLVVDSRGQAFSDTPDLVEAGLSAQEPGFLARGIDSEYHHYYRRFMTDAVLALDAVVTRPDVDPTRLAVAGASQGGGIALAVAGLDDRPAVLLSDVPFLCHFRRAVEVAESGPYLELTRHLSRARFADEEVFRVLSYFDGVNHATRAKAKALFSVGLLDDVCPPSTVYAAYNHYAGPKEMAVYPYNRHEGGGQVHAERRLAFLREALSAQ